MVNRSMRLRFILLSLSLSMFSTCLLGQELSSAKKPEVQQTAKLENLRFEAKTYFGKGFEKHFLKKAYITKVFLGEEPERAKPQWFIFRNEDDAKELNLKRALAMNFDDALYQDRVKNKLREKLYLEWEIDGFEKLIVERDKLINEEIFKISHIFVMKEKLNELYKNYQLNLICARSYIIEHADLKNETLEALTTNVNKGLKELGGPEIILEGALKVKRMSFMVKNLPLGQVIERANAQIDKYSAPGKMEIHGHIWDLMGNTFRRPLIKGDQKSVKELHWINPPKSKEKADEPIDPFAP